MPILGLTGGIATGKSTFAELFQRELESAYFDSDACVHQLLAGDTPTRDAVQTAFGSGVLSPEGWPDRYQNHRDVVLRSGLSPLGRYLGPESNRLYW